MKITYISKICFLIAFLPAISGCFNNNSQKIAETSKLKSTPSVEQKERTPKWVPYEKSVNLIQENYSFPERESSAPYDPLAATSKITDCRTAYAKDNVGYRKCLDSLTQPNSVTNKYN